MFNRNTHNTYNNKQYIIRSTHKYSLLLYVKNRCFVHIRTVYTLDNHKFMDKHITLAYLYKLQQMTVMHTLTPAGKSPNLMRRLTDLLADVPEWSL